MKKKILIIFTVLVSSFEIQSQSILPLLEREDFILDFNEAKKFYLIGTGQLAFEKLDQSAISTKLTTYFKPNKNYGFFISMNKSVIDANTSSDSVNLKNSIVFPDNSNLGFLGNFTYEFIVDDVDFVKKGQDSDPNKKFSKFSHSVFAEFGYQNRNVTFESPNAAPLETSKKLSFDVLYISTGWSIGWAYYGPINFRAMGGINYSISSVNQGFDDFKTLFDISDLESKTFHAVGMKIAIQINALSFTFEGKSILNSNENVKQLKGFQFQLGTLVSGNFLSF